jgi:hypothetical protein
MNGQVAKKAPAPKRAVYVKLPKPVYTHFNQMNGQFPKKAPAPKREVHVKLPKPNVVYYPLASEEATNAYFQHVCTATLPGM